MLKTQEMIQNIVSVGEGQLQLGQKKKDLYTPVALSLAESGDTLADLREAMQTCDGSDWPKSENGGFVGQNKAERLDGDGKPVSKYAYAFGLFSRWLSMSYLKDGDCPVVDEDGELARKPKKEGNGGSKKGSSKATKVEGGPELWTLALQDLMQEAAKLRAAKGKGAKSKKAGAETLAKAVEDICAVLDLELDNEQE